MYSAGDGSDVIAVDSAEIAEAAKLLENIYRCVNIALVNELKPVLDAMDIDIWKVIDAAATKPFGFQAVLSRAGARRALHPDRSLLPDVEGQGVRPPHALHRAGGDRSTARCRST